MRTLAAWGFIAGVAALAIWLARTPTVADGRAIAADLLDGLRGDGVTAMECDAEVPIGQRGAEFRCVATLAAGYSQVVGYTLTPDGQYEPKPQPPTRTPPPRKPASGDPRSDRP